MMVGKKDNDEDTRSALLRAAKQIFSEKGYDGATVKDIADTAGVNVGLISYTFGGKEALYRACLAGFGKQNLEVAQRILQPPRSQEEVRIRLQMFFEELTSAHLADPEVAQIIQRECAINFAATQEVFQESFLKIFQQLIKFVKSAQDGGLTRKEIDPFILASLHFSSLTNAFRMDQMAKKYFGVSLADKKYREKFLKHHLEAILLDLGVPL